MEAAYGIAGVGRWRNHCEESEVTDQERWFRFLLAVLATWRLTHLLTREDGPGDILATLRQWLGDSFLGTLMDCFFCASLWIAAPIAYLLINRWREWPLLWLALSGAACLLERPGSHTSTAADPRRDGE